MSKLNTEVTPLTAAVFLERVRDIDVTGSVLGVEPERFVTPRTPDVVSMEP